MNIPNGFYVIYQPNGQTPTVFDLHERGLFKTRPFVSRDYAYCIISNEDLDVRLQYLCLVEKDVDDPNTREHYSFFVEETLIDLDQELKPLDLAAHIKDEGILQEITAIHDEWCKAFVPLGDDGQTDKEGLSKKLRAAIAERKKNIRGELVRKNSDWVYAAMPRLVQDFQYGLYLRVEDSLYEKYRELGGEEEEAKLIKKMMLFYRVYEIEDQDLLRKPDGRVWRNEDEIWECWTGFAGSEDEAKRVCHTMESIFRPLHIDTADQETV